VTKHLSKNVLVYIQIFYNTLEYCKVERDPTGYHIKRSLCEGLRSIKREGE